MKLNKILGRQERQKHHVNMKIRKLFPIVILVFTQAFVFAQSKGKLVKKDTIKVSNETLFMIKWMRYVGAEIDPIYHRSRANDTLYECNIYCIKLKNKTRNKYHVKLTTDEKRFSKFDAEANLPCYTDSSTVKDVFAIDCPIICKVKITPSKICSDEEVVPQD